jgi:hypothetical protein
MDDHGAHMFCQRAALEIAALINHQRKPRGRLRRDSALLRGFVAQVLSGGMAPHLLQSGPWKVGSRPLKKPGRGGLRFIPLVQRGETTLMVTTQREAEELVAFLNYCGMEELTLR